MAILKYPSLLTDLGHVGENGLPCDGAPWFQNELELCREWGFRLEAANGRVKLLFDHDQLVPYWVQKETAAIAWDWLRVSGYFRLESTNSEALVEVRQGTPSGTLVYAEEQTAGRGRSDHAWYSHRGAGLYFTIVLRPTQPLRWWPLLTHVASVALVETLKELSVQRLIPNRLSPEIKWPNDVLISGRKCAGILLETHVDGNNRAAVVGVGINVHNESVPESLSSSAVCLDEAAGTVLQRRQLLVQFLHNLQLRYMEFERGDHGAVLERWKNNSSMWQGEEILIVEGEESRRAVTCGLDSMGALIVRSQNGKQETVVAGDIQLLRRSDH